MPSIVQLSRHYCRHFLQFSSVVLRTARHHTVSQTGRQTGRPTQNRDLSGEGGLRAAKRSNGTSQPWRNCSSEPNKPGHRSARRLSRRDARSTFERRWPSERDSIPGSSLLSQICSCEFLSLDCFFCLLSCILYLAPLTQGDGRAAQLEGRHPRARQKLGRQPCRRAAERPRKCQRRCNLATRVWR